MINIIRKFERGIILTLLSLMMIAVLAATIELAFILYQELLKPPLLLLNIKEMLEVFGFFLMVLIGIELLESIKAYLEKDKIHVEVVFLVALIAISRKVVIIDYKTVSHLVIFSMAALVLALSCGFFLVKNVLKTMSRSQSENSK
jgi:uncharacterized membrane protein (DUF373 family)